MPTYTIIEASKEAAGQLTQPITVINRAINIHSIVKKHSHQWSQFIYASQGILAVTSTTARYIVPPQQGVWITPETDHEVTALSNVELTSFYFRNSLLASLPNQCGVLEVNSFLKVLILEAKYIASDYQWHKSDGRLLRLIQDRICEAKVIALQLPSPRDKRLLVMLNSLQREPNNRHSLDQWSRVVGASARSLSRLFKQQTGLTYTQWRQRLMIQISITQLSQGQSVGNVSLSLGYESPSAFIHMFKTNTGVTPSSYTRYH